MNRLEVGDLLSDDDFAVVLAQTTMDTLGITHGDTVLLVHKGCETLGVAHADTSEDTKHAVARMGINMRRNLHVNLEDEVSIAGLGDDVPIGQKICVLPVDDTVDGNVTPNELFQDFLQPFFAGVYRPVRQGDLFLMRSKKSAGQDVEFAIMKTEPAPYCLVGPDTIIYCEVKAVAREDVL